MTATTLILCTYRAVSPQTHHAIVQLMRQHPDWDEVIVDQAPINRARLASNPLSGVTRLGVDQCSEPGAYLAETSHSMRRPCAECPWVVAGFRDPDELRRFARRARDGDLHLCHMNTRRSCAGARLFATQPVMVRSYNLLIETAYRLRREGRLRN